MTLLTTHNTCSEPAIEGPKMGHQSVTVRNNEMVYFENLTTIMTHKRGYLLQTSLVIKARVFSNSASRLNL